MILSFGEVLVDTYIDKKSGKKTSFVGGAPFNLSYQAALMNDKVLFVGNIGDDEEGRMILDFMNTHQMDISQIRIDKNRKTTVSQVTIGKDGERSFSFLRENACDYLFDESSLKLIKKADIVHLGSLMLSKKEGRDFFFATIRKAKDFHKIISFDFNYRSDIYHSEEEAKDIYRQVYPLCDIVKLSIDELKMFSFGESIEELIDNLNDKPKLVLITLGKNGSIACYKGKTMRMESIKTNPVDTTGAGDSFYGTMLSLIDSIGLDEILMIDSLLSSSLRFSNIAGAMTTMKKGALSSMPPYDDVEKTLSNGR